jgi:hypothetical protein
MITIEAEKAIRKHRDFFSGSALVQARCCGTAVFIVFVDSQDTAWRVCLGCHKAQPITYLEPAKSEL